MLVKQRLQPELCVHSVQTTGIALLVFNAQCEYKDNECRSDPCLGSRKSDKRSNTVSDWNELDQGLYKEAQIKTS